MGVNNFADSFTQTYIMRFKKITLTNIVIINVKNRGSILWHVPTNSNIKERLSCSSIVVI